ncbi:hypothetical protein PV328_006882 [Microctonus aethiopoides]|uniref:Coiled-coil domain-containing protein 40 n=1 Tax=Microctonus aethiopoides TaxID=144406 RepID=A0AA39FQM4_9HYME|nr:hypothetical protein PV328_006882 [Microctonus aethiopoides]
MSSIHEETGSQDMIHQDETNFETYNKERESVESLKVLDPDDPLMKRFQDALKAHLIKLNDGLTKDINELAKRLHKGNEMYEAQLEIHNQVTLIDKWRTSLETMKCWCEKEKNDVKSMKETRNIAEQERKKELEKAESMSHEIESVSLLCRRFADYEEEVSNYITIAKRMSEKDARVERELIRQKQEMDYIMLKASETVWKLERELNDLQKQIEIKNNEKLTMNQVIADADTDLEVFEREQKNLINSWNKVLYSVQQRDKAYDALSTERMNVRESLKNINTRIEKVKKDTIKEMHSKEQLMRIQSRINEEIYYNEETIKVHNDKFEVVQYKTDSAIQLIQNTETELKAATSAHQRLTSEENAVDRQLEKLSTQKSALEDEVMAKLADKITQNKTVKRLNKMLRDMRETKKQFELTMLQTENIYAKGLMEAEKLNNALSIEKAELMELDEINNQKNAELNKLHNEIEKCNLLIERKQKKIGELNKSIGEINAASGNSVDMVAPHVIKIASLEKSIEELEATNAENQRYWLRHEAVIVNLTDERNGKLQEINRLNKQIIILEQKNLKLGHAFEKENKIQQNIEKRMNDLHQRLTKNNTILAEQREMRDQLQDKNFIVNDEYTRTLQQTEREFINLQNNIKDLTNEKCILEEKLQDEIRNNLTWDKKLKLAMETTKFIKQEQNPGGDVAVMRSEIRKMEMRLSYLKKVQEKMIRDMELCVTKREMIVDAALTKQMKNPKVMHNKQVMFEKRMDGRRLEIKQIRKEIIALENATSKLKKENEMLENEEKETEKLLKNIQSELIELNKQIAEGEIMKHHKLECLVRKQRKIKLLQSVRDGKYKIICKSVVALNDSIEYQKTLNSNLIEIMEQVNKDFPLIKDNVKKILLTLQPS